MNLLIMKEQGLRVNVRSNPRTIYFTHLLCLRPNSFSTITAQRDWTKQNAQIHNMVATDSCSSNGWITPSVCFFLLWRLKKTTLWNSSIIIVWILRILHSFMLHIESNGIFQFQKDFRLFFHWYTCSLIAVDQTFRHNRVSKIWLWSCPEATMRQKVFTLSVTYAQYTRHALYYTQESIAYAS